MVLGQGKGRLDTRKPKRVPVVHFEEWSPSGASSINATSCKRILRKVNGERSAKKRRERKRGMHINQKTNTQSNKTHRDTHILLSQAGKQRRARQGQ